MSHSLHWDRLTQIKKITTEIGSQDSTETIGPSSNSVSREAPAHLQGIDCALETSIGEYRVFWFTVKDVSIYDASILEVI